MRIILHIFNFRLNFSRINKKIKKKTVEENIFTYFVNSMKRQRKNFSAVYKRITVFENTSQWCQEVQRTLFHV